MIQSMTAFGRSQEKNEWGMAVWEVRSINHRYLEINIRLPDMLRELEQNVRDLIHRYISRGKIECTLRFIPGDKFGTSLLVNQHLLKQLIAISHEVSQHLPEKMIHLNIADLLAWEGVVVQETLDVTPLKSRLLDLFLRAMEGLKQNRQREGKNLLDHIEQRLDSIAFQVNEVKAHLPGLLERQREKILHRLGEAKASLDLPRLEQEMVYFAQKIDVSEEIDRLLSHIKEVKRTLSQGQAMGRRLDFMMQELNREANTLASKSVESVIIHAAVEMKVLIEQIREQVQNIE